MVPNREMGGNMSVFNDQAEFMQACAQTTGQYNWEQVKLYMRLIEEEVGETREGVTALSLRQKPTVAQLADAVDGALDVIVVAIGLLHSLGVDPQPLWDEVAYSNRKKIDPATGKVRKREDGKVLKPDGWEPPRLAELIAKQHVE